MIKYFTNSEIDKQKWDICIEESFNGKPYAYSWYLNLVSPNWDALVLNDYEAVMPLTHLSKFSISYLFQPIMCQQLGVYSAVKNIAFCVDEFLNAIPSKFNFIEISINSKNYISQNNGVFEIIRSNQYLPLSLPYKNLEANFHPSHKKNNSKAKRAGIEIKVNSISIDTFIEMKLKSLKTQNVNLTKNNQAAYRNLLKELDHRNYLKIYSAHHNNAPVSFAAFATIGKWATIQSFNTEAGRKLSAGYLLNDAFIKDHSESDLCLDFMGSSIPGIASYNKGYGAIEENYSFIRLNRLPWFIKLFKR
jgi:hypothetical protein